MDSNKTCQPPKPPPAARKEAKMKPKMVGGNNNSTRTYYPRLTDIKSLPEEVLFEVLVRLPAQDIYNPARLVCSKWYHMIHTHTFIYAHLQRSTYGLLFQSMLEDSLFVSVGESGRVEISKKKYDLRFHSPTSCNGLLLGFKSWSNDNIYVSNHTTRQMFALPQLVGYPDYTISRSFGIAYAAASMEYKAVITVSVEGRKRTCFILTIGVDNSWRTVGSECESLKTKEFFDTPLITEGFVHWYNINTNDVLTMNVETEIITDTSGPTHRVVYGNRENIFLSTGIYLSLLIPCGEFCWEVWEMKPKIDYRWRKVSDISLEAHKCSLTQRFGINERDFLIPIGWLKYPEVLVFRIWSQTFVFNLLTQEIVTIELPMSRYIYKIVVHKNSLVWLGGC